MARRPSIAGPALRPQPQADSNATAPRQAARPESGRGGCRKFRRGFKTQPQSSRPTRRDVPLPHLVDKASQKRAASCFETLRGRSPGRGGGLLRHEHGVPRGNPARFRRLGLHSTRFQAREPVSLCQGNRRPRGVSAAAQRGRRGGAAASLGERLPAARRRKGLASSPALVAKKRIFREIRGLIFAPEPLRDCRRG